MSDNGADRNGSLDAAVRSQTVILLVTDEADSSQGKIKVCSDAEQASRMIETLLEAGHEQGRIRAFSGVESEIAVAYRPVVTLGGTAVAGLESPPARFSASAAQGGRLSDHMPSAADEVG